jgi:hypothetical protein
MMAFWWCGERSVGSVVVIGHPLHAGLVQYTSGFMQALAVSLSNITAEWYGAVPA